MSNQEIERKWVLDLNVAQRAFLDKASKTVLIQQGYVDPVKSVSFSEDTVTLAGISFRVPEKEQFSSIWSLFQTPDLKNIVARYRITEEDGDLHAYLTFKGQGGLKRIEEEFTVDPKQASLLQPHAFGVIYKRRLYVNEFTPTLEVDLYDPRHRFSFAVFEVEFPSEKEASTYQLPKPVKALNPIEVTEDFAFTNVKLALEPQKAIHTYQKVYAER